MTAKLHFFLSVTLGLPLWAGKTSFEPFDRWYEVFIGEVKVGYSHDRMYAEGEQIKSSNELVMEIKRVGQTLEITNFLETREKANGELIDFATEQKMAGVPMLKKGRVEGNRLIVFEKQFLTGKESAYAFDRDAGMSWGLRRRMLENGFREKGKTYQLKTYSPDMGMKKPVFVNVACKGKKRIQVGKATIDAYEVEMELKSSYGSILSKSWLDDQCVAVRSEMNMGGMNILMIEVPKKKARQMEEETHELLLGSLVPLNAAVSLERASNVFVMESIRGNWDVKLFEGRTQRVEKINRRSVRVVVTREDSSQATPDPIDKTAFLKPSVYLDSSDLLIQKLARKAQGQAQAPREIAENLTSFVHRYVASKSYAVGFASASEVARTKEGDCTEHSVLLAALGRALEIPSRVVTGLVYADRFEGKRKVMVYHMWTQFYIDDRWVNYDSALGYANCPADRIAFTVSSMEAEDVIESILPVMELINNARVRIESSE